MAKVKKIEQESTKVSKKKRISSSAKTSNKKEESPQALIKKELWQAEVQALRKLEFVTLEEGLHELIGKVLLKLRIPKSQEKATREFLFQFFDTDPALKQELRGVLKIKHA